MKIFLSHARKDDGLARELAFLPRHRVNARQISRAGERRKLRYAGEGERRGVERKAALGDDFAEGDIGGGLAMRRHHIGERGKLALVGPLARRGLRQRLGEIVQAGGVEPGDNPRRFVARV